MIDIQNKASCTGCYACVRICPKQCISMQPDEEGFWYPSVDKGICVNCGLCEKVCAVAHPFPIRQPLATYAARSKQAKYLSLGSSGGIFQPLAERVIADGGVVFGVRFNEHWEVIHDKAEVPEELPAFSGSKYVQSRTGDTYREAEGFLKAGRKVLFSGTPCQIAGLYAYLRKPYENLYTVDFICHGVPSPKVWQIYLNEISKRLQQKYPDSRLHLSEVSFRDKSSGWNDSSLSVHYTGKKQGAIACSEKKSRNVYFRGFLGNLYLRPSCHHCPCKEGKSNSDITLGDFWGIGKVCPSFDDDKGTSVVMLNSPRGISLWKTIETESLEVTLKDIVSGNEAYTHSSPYPPERRLFFQDLHQSADSLSNLIRKYTRRNYISTLRSIAGRVLRKITR